MDKIAQDRDPSEKMTSTFAFKIAGRKPGSLGNAMVEIRSDGDGRTTLKVEGACELEVLTADLVSAVRHLEMTEGRNP